MRSHVTADAMKTITKSFMMRDVKCLSSEAAVCSIRVKTSGRRMRLWSGWFGRLSGSSPPVFYGLDSMALNGFS